MYNAQNIALRIKQRIKEKGINLKIMLTDLGLGINAISQMAKGQSISCITLAQIADYLNCSVDFLLDREKPVYGITEHEKKVMTAYRDNVEMQPAVDKLLGIEEDNTSIKSKLA